jgi:hypothetical protein
MAVSMEGRALVLPAVIVGIALVLGLSIAGYFVGRGAARFRSDARVVTVKGLVEREVKADQAVWTLGLRRASETLQDAHTRISADRDAAVAFLRRQGFAETEIERQPTRIVEREGGGANPRYVVSKFNDLRPQLLADATRNARATAQQFAADSGARVGGIRLANQGSIQIFGLDGGDESAPFSPTSTPVKRIRVVSTFEFELR